MPYDCAERLASTLHAHAVPHELHTINDAEHGLTEPADPKQLEAAYSAAAAFVGRCLRARVAGGSGSSAL